MAAGSARHHSGANPHPRSPTCASQRRFRSDCPFTSPGLSPDGATRLEDDQRSASSAARSTRDRARRIAARASLTPINAMP